MKCIYLFLFLEKVPEVIVWDFNVILTKDGISFN